MGQWSLRGDGNDFINANNTSGNYYVHAGSGQDTFVGENGNDVFIHTATDSSHGAVLKMGDGSDTMHLSRDASYYIISELDSDGLDLNEIYLNGSIDTSRLSFHREYMTLSYKEHISTYGDNYGFYNRTYNTDAGDLIIRYQNTNGNDLNIIIDNYFGSVTSNYYRFSGVHIDNLHYNNTTIDLSTLSYTTEGTSNDDRIVGVEQNGNNADELYGHDGNDRLKGLSGNDLIFGGAGDDSLEGGEGDDELSGGTGNDTVYDQWGTNTIIASSGHDIITANNLSKVLYSTTNNVTSLDFSRSGQNLLVFSPDGAIAEIAHWQNSNSLHTLEFANGSTFDVTTLDLDIEGTSSNDTLYGFLNTQMGDDIINGYAGDDIAFARGGNDTLNGGSGSDELYGEDGNDTIRGGDDNDYKLYGGNGSDNIYGDAGDDTLYGDAGGDMLNGGTGADILWGGEGDDTLHGGDGDDAKLDGGNGNDTINGDAGNDTLYGRDGNDVLDSGDGNDIFYGHEGNDILDGGDGEDFILAGTGDDTLNGGLGYDRLYGNAGADTFMFTDYSQYTSIYDRVHDFSEIDGDVLDISDLISSYDSATENLSDYVFVHHNTARSYIYIDNDGTGTNSSMEYAIRMDGVFWDDADMTTLITNGTVIV